MIERALLLCPGGVIGVEHLPADQTGGAPCEPRSTGPASFSPDGQGERERIRAALERSAGNQTAAARMLGIARRTMVNRMNKFGFPRPRKGRSPPTGS